MTTTNPLIAMPDADLLTHVTRLASAERQATAHLIAALAELDARQLYLGQGCSSLFTYCTQVLHLSEHAAYGRIEAARAARRFPTILERLGDGSLTLTAVCLLAPLLTPDNYLTVLDAARYRTKREVEVLVAGLRPQPPVPTALRKLPATPVARSISPGAAPRSSNQGDGPVQTTQAISGIPAPDLQAATSTPPGRASSRVSVVSPLTPEQYKMQVTISRETVEKLRRVQDLMRHTVPDGSPALILDRALTALLAELERTKLAATNQPRHGRPLTPGSRHVPAAVRRTVWSRDRGRCAFVSPAGRRCTERGFLEFHHTAPYAAGGEATADTIELRCRAHNLYEAQLDFGPAALQWKHASRSSP